MFHIRRGTCPCSNDCGGRLWRSGACCNIESFWKCRKRIPFSTWLCESETLSSTWTVTGSGAFLVGKKKSRVRISGVTIGKIVDYGLKDSQNMGACMAPAACDTILQNLMDLEGVKRITTGSLPETWAMWDNRFYLTCFVRRLDIKENHMDCGMTIFDQQTQHTNSGGSGCGCAAITLAAYIMPQLISGSGKGSFCTNGGADVDGQLQ